MNRQELLTQLADIEIPASPPDQTEWIWLPTTLIIVIVLSACVYYWRKHYSKQHAQAHTQTTALSKLDQLKKQWQSGTLNPRQTAYQLATLLRLGLGLTQLSPTRPAIITQHHERWTPTIRLLQELRYNGHSNEYISAQTFTLVRDWLNSAKRSKS